VARPADGKGDGSRTTTSGLVWPASIDLTLPCSGIRPPSTTASMAPRPDLGAPLAEWAAAEIRESLEDVLHCRRQLQESYASAPWASVHTAEYAAAKQARAVIRACIRAARTRLRTAEKDLFAACATSRVSGAPAPIAS
jgi:hypothetical protein